MYLATQPCRGLIVQRWLWVRCTQTTVCSCYVPSRPQLALGMLEMAPASQSANSLFNCAQICMDMRSLYIQKADALLIPHWSGNIDSLEESFFDVQMAKLMLVLVSLMLRCAQECVQLESRNSILTMEEITAALLASLMAETADGFFQAVSWECK